MSFIYAEKFQKDDRESVKVLCDTKTTPNNFSASNFSTAAYDLILNHGIVKSTICCPELCVSFAGNNTVLASRLLRQLNDLGEFEEERVSDHAYKIHKDAPDPNDIEFIITYITKGNPHIDCVKNGKLDRDLQIAHIGSEEAFREFQRIRLSAGGDAAKRTESAFRGVVDGCIDETVGGNVIAVIYDNQSGSFVYRWEKALHESKPQLVEIGKNIVFNTPPSDGGYSHEIEHKGIENVLLTIDQMKPAVLYSRRFRIDDSDLQNPNLFGLMLPMLVVQNENGEFVRYR